MNYLLQLIDNQSDPKHLANGTRVIATNAYTVLTYYLILETTVISEPCVLWCECGKVKESFVGYSVCLNVCDTVIYSL